MTPEADEIRFLLASQVMMLMKIYEMVTLSARLQANPEVKRKVDELVDLHEAGQFMTAPPFSQEPTDEV